MADIQQQQSKYFLPYQVEAIESEDRLVLWEKSIRIGATYAMAYRAVKRRFEGRGDYLHTSVNERVALSFAKQCRAFAKIWDAAASIGLDEFSSKNPVTDRQESAYILTFPNGFTIKVFSSNPEAIRGEGGEVGIDELSSHRDPAAMMQAAGGRAMWGQSVCIWTSHKGAESAFNLLIKEQRALGDESRWKIRSTDLYTALDQGLLDKINEVRRTETEAAGRVYVDLERESFIKDTTAMVGGQEAFNEECLLQPQKGGESAIKWSLIDAARVDYTLVRHHITTELDTKVIDAVIDYLRERIGSIEFGYDVARTGHLSSIWFNVRNELKKRLAVLLTMKGIRFRSQQQMVDKVLYAIPQSVGCGDSTGLGMQVCEELEEDHGDARFKGVNFGALKPELGTGMVKLYEDEAQEIPSAREHEDIAYDISSVRVERTAARTRFYETPNPINKDSHSDMFWSNALAEFASIGGREQGMW